MKIASPLFIAVAAVTFSLAGLSQEHPSQPSGGGAGEHHHAPAPAPTNLKVLPKNLTGEQVHEIMHKWAGELGTECTTCHAVDPNRKRPDGRPMLNFADDSKAEKNTARLMLRMTMDINKKYLSEVKDDDHDKGHEGHEGHGKEEAAVSCGTCHRGNVHPPPFTPKEDHDHDHPAAAKP